MVRQRFAKPYRGNKPLRGFESRTLRLRPDLIGAAADSVRNFGGVREWFIRAVLNPAPRVEGWQSGLMRRS